MTQILILSKKQVQPPLHLLFGFIYRVCEGLLD